MNRCSCVPGACERLALRMEQRDAKGESDRRASLIEKQAIGVSVMLGVATVTLHHALFAVGVMSPLLVARYWATQEREKGIQSIRHLEAREAALSKVCRHQ